MRGSSSAAVMVSMLVLGSGCAAPPGDRASDPAGPPARHAICKTDLRALLGADRPRPRDEGKADGPRAERDPFGVLPNLRTSTHFALKWGSQATVSEALAEKLLADLEHAWQVEVTERGFPAPRGSDAYLVNVYIGNSGDGAPINLAGTAITVRDLDGYAFLNLYLETLIGQGSTPGYVRSLMAHELFHAIQDAIGIALYPSGDEDWYWYTEATAEWAAELANGEGDDTMVGVYLLTPDVSLTYYTYASADELLANHHYGASLYLSYLSEVASDWTLVKESLTQQAGAPGPLEALDALLAARGQPSTDALFPDFAARNATVDYARREAYVDSARAWEGYLHRGARVQLALEGSGTGWTDAPVDTAPQRLGYGVTRLAHPAAGSLRVGIEAQPGTAGTPARMQAAIARSSAGGIEYLPVAFDAAGITGAATIPDVGTETEIFLVVTAQPASAVGDERFPYRLRMEVTAADAPDARDAAAESGCTMAGARPSAPTTWLVLGILGLLLRPRRRGIRRA